MDRTIRLLHGSRLDALADRLVGTLAAAPPADPLADEIVVVPHPGMGRWLQQVFAHDTGIAAGLALVLPGRFVWSTARAIEGALPEQSGWERDALEWRIHGALADGVLAREPVVARYLDADDPLRAWELAQRLADAFDQYALYRPGWLACWARDEPALSHRHEAWQRRLWRAVHAGVGEPHRAEVVERIVATLESRRGDTALASRLPARVGVFGVSSMPELHVRFFGALARHVEVTWYQLVPTTGWWGDAVLRRERARLLAKLAAQGVAEDEAHVERTHPLLAAWGRIGRDTQNLLWSMPLDDEAVEGDGEPGGRECEGEGVGQTGDLFATPAVARPRGTLAWLRTSLDAQEAKPGPPPLDGSLLVHACATRLREVEVLHDALLARFEDDATLTPRDVVITTPKLADYAPLVEAVFSAAPESRRIPYTIADRSARDAHPLVGAWLSLLALPGSRLAASEVAELVSVDAIARRSGLEGEGRESLMAWIDALAIRFGLDAEDRRRAGLGDWGDFAWRTGLDRIVLGYALGDDAAGAVLEGADGTPLAPHPGVEGQRAALAGRVARLVERLAEWRARLAGPRTIEAWQSLANGLLEEFVDARPGDVESAAALASIRAGVERVVEAAKRGGEAQRPVPHAVFLASVEAELGEPERHARFLAAGVTVCAMVPMRNVPFRVVCVLGLDDGEFPRREPEPSFHLMRAEPRAGDRTREDDDRYLFLESLLAARDAVHLSHVCINARDGSRRPPSAVVTDLVEFVAGAAAVPDDARLALVVEHPAAAWDPRAYRGSGGLSPGAPTDHSYDDRWLPAASALVGPRRGPVPFAQPAPIAPDGDVPDDAARPELAFAEVFAFYRNPPRDYLRQVLGVSLARERTIEDDEPQAGGGLVRYGVDDALLGDLVADPAVDDATLVARLRARAKLRPGRAGLHDAQARIACVRRVVSRYRALVGEASIERRLARLETRRATLAGELEAVAGLGPVRLRAGVSRLGDWVELALSMLALEAPCAIFVGVERDEPCVERLELGDLDPAWTEQVVACHLAARSGLAPLLRHASWCYAEHAGDPAKALREALAVLEGRRGPRERETDPAAALVLRGREPAFGEAWEAAASVLLAPLRERIRSVAP